MIVTRSNVPILHFLSVLVVILNFCCGLHASDHESGEHSHLMRRGIGNKPQQHPEQGSQSGLHSTSAPQQQGHQQLSAQQLLHAHLRARLSSIHHAQQHAQLRDSLYRPAARGGISSASPSVQPRVSVKSASSAKFELVPVPDGLHDHDARAHLQNIQSKAYADGHRLKGHAVIQVPSNHEAKHDLPKVTVHSGRRAGLVHTSFLQAPSTPRQPQQSQMFSQQHHPGSSSVDPGTHQPVHSFQLSGYTAPSTARTHSATTANLLDRVSGQQPSQPITQHAGDKRRREGHTNANLDTTLKLGKRSLEDYSQYRPLKKRASSSASDSKGEPSPYQRHSPDSASESGTRRGSGSKYTDSYNTILRLRDDGHTIKGTSDVGIVADKKARIPLPQIDVDHGRRKGHVVSWVTISPKSAKKRDKIESRIRHQRFSRSPTRKIKSQSASRSGSIKEPSANIKATSPARYRFGFIETDSDFAEHQTRNAVERRLDRGHHLPKVKVSRTLGISHSDHTLPALHITPGKTKARVTSIFFHREHSPASTPSTSPHRTQKASTTNLIESLSGRNHSPDHSGDKRKREGSSDNNVDTKLKLGKRSLKDFSQYSEFSILEKRADDQGESSKQQSSSYRQSSPTQMSGKRFSDSQVAIHQLKKGGHRVKGILDVGVPSDKSAQHQLPQIQVQHGHMTGHAVSWITGARTVAERKVRFQLRKGKETYYRKPGKDEKLYTTRPYRAAFIETHSKHADSHLVNDVDQLLKQDQRLFDVKINDVHHHRNSDHTFPALQITPGQKKTRVTSAFFHREKPTASKQPPEQSQPITQHAGDKRNRDGITKMELGKRSLHHEIQSPRNSIGIWKRGENDDPPRSKGPLPKAFENSFYRNEARGKYRSSIDDLKRLKGQGHTVKAISNIGVHADSRETRTELQVSIRDGRRSGHVVTWVMQHPKHSSTAHVAVYRRKILPSTSHHGPDVHVSGFVELSKHTNDDEGIVSRGVYNLHRNGYLLKHTSTVPTRRDPNASHKLPAVHVRPGNEHARVLSVFVTPRKSSPTTHQHSSPGPSTQHSSEAGQTMNLIERLGGASSPQHSHSSSSSRDSSPGVRSNKRPRTDLRL
ncbi:uncharacterized protein FA14DRAFT_153863 [Meira miltonrushii]|uniref:Uncharacterized protein n=1 Tax=Meira miltonrushii TaxID=1280837 RepID=A0A316VLP9_9BASI|nr:uncharacterized protein FA14DRAFT_153863 [Meira miltonrushii]PWN38539.1 hypothetical protein FA14DRAFT_153863 [Meira miltonrushii]